MTTAVDLLGVQASRVLIGLLGAKGSQRGPWVVAANEKNFSQYVAAVCNRIHHATHAISAL